MRNLLNVLCMIKIFINTIDRKWYSTKLYWKFHKRIFDENESQAAVPTLDSGGKKESTYSIAT